MKSPRPRIAQVALPLPLRQEFDYLLPSTEANLAPGARVQVPFGNRQMIGYLVAQTSQSKIARKKLKPIAKVVDKSSLFDESLLNTLHWVAQYYLAPLGEVFDLTLPLPLRRGKAAQPVAQGYWRLSDYGRHTNLEKLQNAPLQRALVERLSRRDTLTSADFRSDSRSWRSALNSLIKKGWVTQGYRQPELNTHLIDATNRSVTEVRLNSEQQSAADALGEAIKANRFSCTLLHGVTGSGKTEVYFNAMHRVLAQNKQVLLLVPEIGLTPQLMQRINAAFKVPVVNLHSGLNDSERHLQWWHAYSGNAQIAVGTRSAVFTPMPNPGLVIVDEEHDPSFKQQEGVRYQARDVAIYRAKQMNIPIILGSATPSLQTYKHAVEGNYQLLQLRSRAHSTPLPNIDLLDLNRLPVNDGLSLTLIEAIEKTLAEKAQVMLFLNRRGYAPVLFCKSCETVSTCHRCDANLTVHQQTQQLRCHHCGFQAVAKGQCRQCQSENLTLIGEGTQRVEEALQERFPEARIARIDRDSTRRKGKLEQFLHDASARQFDILLGTQMLTKGHDFAGVALVGVLGADHGLYSTDFRARETLFQQLTQVAGRAGRRHSVGQVLIQTAFVQDPFFTQIKEHDYAGFADQLLSLRAVAGYPPCGYFALLRADSPHQRKALLFLQQAVCQLNALNSVDVKVNDAIPAPMEKRAGRYRAQLLIQSGSRKALNHTLQAWLCQIDSQPQSKTLKNQVRWSLDIDPIDLY